MYHRNILVEQADPEVWAAIQAENARQEHHIELIASENYASPAVLAAQGSQLTNKYAEGYPGKRYYGGCEHVDVVEQLAIDRVKQIFGADAANVQPHCGASANEAVFLAFLKPGDTIMGMSLAEGGHLTHGMPLNMSGKATAAAQSAMAEAEQLRSVLSVIGVAVYVHDERLTTVSADRSLMEMQMKADARRRVVDKVAAAVMLQGFIDHRRNTSDRA